jgi:hypothetical protein
MEEKLFYSCHDCKTNGLQKRRFCSLLNIEGGDLWEFDGQAMTGCHVHKVTQDSLHYLQVLNFLENGVLPEAGGLNDQYEYDLIMIGIGGSERAAIQENRNQG